MSALIITNGRIIDPNMGLDKVGDVFIEDSHIISLFDYEIFEENALVDNLNENFNKNFEKIVKKKKINFLNSFNEK